MAIELKPEARRMLIEQIMCFCDEALECRVGDLKAALVLDFFLQELGPAVYNQALADSQRWLLTRLEDLESSLFMSRPLVRKKPAGPRNTIRS